MIEPLLLGLLSSLELELLLLPLLLLLLPQARELLLPVLLFLLCL